MMVTVSIIEIVIMSGVLWNAFLQTYWFFWSKKIHDKSEYGRKHFSDSEEIDLGIPNQVKRPVPSEVSPPQRKYNPDEIEGKLDVFFKNEKEK